MTKNKYRQAPTYIARHRTECVEPTCETIIQPGDTIVLQDGGHAHYACQDQFMQLPSLDPEELAPSPVGLQPGEVVCTLCNLAHRGECF